MKKLNFKIIAPVTIGLFILIIIFTIVLPKKSSQETAFLEKYDLDTLTVTEMVPYLDRIITEKPGFYAAITAKTLTIGDKDNEYNYNVPKDKFYLSLAPYINTTHPCANHNLVTCRGELVNKTFTITVKDSLNKVIINGEYTSGDNGFVGIWLPKDITGTITVNYQGLSASGDINTSSSSNTCLTTLKLN